MRAPVHLSHNRRNLIARMTSDGDAAMIERIGIQALCVLGIVWVYFLVKYLIGWQFPAILDTAMVVVGVAAGIGVFLWLTKHSKRL